MKFGHYIREGRLARRLLVREVAEQLGIDASLLSRMEREERLPGADMLPKLAEVLDLNASELQKQWLASKVLRQLEDYPSLVEDVLGLVMEQVERYIPSKLAELPEDLTNVLLRADDLRNEAAGKHPLHGSQLERLRDFFHTRYTYHSNRIEGNTLTLQETALVVGKGITIAGKTVREHLEAVNHQEAVEYLEGLVQKGSRLSDGLIKELHYLVLKGIDKKWAGAYRQSEVRISGSEHIPPQHFEIGAEMQRLMAYYHEQKGRLHPILLAADMHLMLVGIHPFMDGNGRTSRLLMNLILMQGGYYIANIKGDLADRLEYYEALEEAHVRGNTLPFRKLVAAAVEQNLAEYVSMLS